MRGRILVHVVRVADETGTNAEETLHVILLQYLCMANYNVNINRMNSSTHAANQAVDTPSARVSTAVAALQVR